MVQVKIKIIAAYQDHIQLEPLHRPKLKEFLKEMGIVFVKTNPDIILFHNYKATPKEKQCLKGKTPIIILERVAAAKIVSRKFISQTNVIGVAKSTNFRDLNINNSSFATTTEKGNYHSRLIFESFNKKREYSNTSKFFTKKDFSKIELWYNFNIYEMMKLFIKKPVDYCAPRKIDINFYGTTTYGPNSNAITLHRKKCMGKIKSLKNCVIDIKQSREIKSKYIDALRKSKIGISPWGLGEKCYRDFEAIYAGCVLLKPDTSFVIDWMDSYNLKNKLYIPCKLDFSDLQEKVDWIKDNWVELIEHRKFAYNKCLSYWDEKKIANHIYGVIKRCVGRIK